MATVFRRHSRKRTGNRRSRNWQLKLGGTSACGNCGAERAPHTICAQCGFYDGKLVLPKKVKKKKAQEQPPEGGEGQG